MNPIIQAIKNNTLKNKGITISISDRPYYLLDYVDERVGVFSSVGLTRYYSYSELGFVNDEIKHSIPVKSPFFGIETVSAFLTKVIHHNYSFVTINAETGNKNKTLPSNFIKTVYWHNPKTGIMEEINLSDTVKDTADQLMIEEANRFYENRKYEQDLLQDMNILIKSLRMFILRTIKEKQKTNSSQKTISGQLALNVIEELNKEKNILSEYKNIMSRAYKYNVKMPLISVLVERSLNHTSWKLARDIDLNRNPYIYLLPKTAPVSNPRPGFVLQDDPEVALISNVSNTEPVTNTGSVTEEQT